MDVPRSEEEVSLQELKGKVKRGSLRKSPSRPV